MANRLMLQHMIYVSLSLTLMTAACSGRSNNSDYIRRQIFDALELPVIEEVCALDVAKVRNSVAKSKESATTLAQFYLSH